METSKNLKARILLYTFGVPLIWLAVWTSKNFFPDFPFNKSVALGLIIGSSFRVFIKRKFLLNIRIEGTQAIFTYRTQLLQKKTFELPVEHIGTLLYRKKRWYESFDKVTLKNKKLWKEFYMTPSNDKLIQERLSAIRTLKRQVQVHVS